MELLQQACIRCIAYLIVEICKRKYVLDVPVYDGSPPFVPL